jgi:hypothetical protein
MMIYTLEIEYGEYFLHLHIWRWERGVYDIRSIYTKIHEEEILDVRRAVSNVIVRMGMFMRLRCVFWLFFIPRGRVSSILCIACCI